MGRRKIEEAEEEEELVEIEKAWEWTDGVTDVPPNEFEDPFSIRHTSVRYGRKRYRVGDIVQIQGDTAHKWIGLIHGFATDYGNEKGEQKRALVLWFCRQQDVSKRRRREGAGKVPTPHQLCVNISGRDIH
jgi:hypothetical protein